MTRKRPTKAVIAAAGFGTRFLPQTKAMPKEMLPIVDKPIIQYVVEDLVEAGIKDIIIVTGYSKRSIEDHFDMPNGELSSVLTSGGKIQELESLKNIATMANFVYVRQHEMLGNTGPLFYARHLLQNEPFIYTWGDEFIAATPNRFESMIKLHEQTGGSVYWCMKVEKDEDYDRYGILTAEPDEQGRLRTTKITEKPGKANATSDLYSVGGYILTPDILPFVEKAVQEHEGTRELTIQPTMQKMMDQGYEYYACYDKNSIYYDAGNKLDYLKTVVQIALQREDIGEGFRRYLKGLSL